MSDKQMKMTDVFEGVVVARWIGDEELQEFLHGEDNGNSFCLEDDRYWLAASEDHIKYAAHAINNHDRLTAENEALRDEVERVRAANLDSVAVCDQALRAKAAAEQERDQLKAALQRFMELDQNDRDLPLELWAVQHDVSPVDISLALHDAEVIERMVDGLRAGYINRSIHYSELYEYANQLRQQANDNNS